MSDGGRVIRLPLPDSPPAPITPTTPIRPARYVLLTATEIEVLRESARRLRWIGAVVTADVMSGIVKEWEDNA